MDNLDYATELRLSPDIMSWIRDAVTERTNSVTTIKPKFLLCDNGHIFDEDSLGEDASCPRCGESIKMVQVVAEIGVVGEASESGDLLTEDAAKSFTQLNPVFTLLRRGKILVVK